MMSQIPSVSPKSTWDNFIFLQFSVRHSTVFYVWGNVLQHLPSLDHKNLSPVKSESDHFVASNTESDHSVVSNPESDHSIASNIESDHSISSNTESDHLIFSNTESYHSVFFNTESDHSVASNTESDLSVGSRHIHFNPKTGVQAY